MSIRTDLQRACKDLERGLERPTCTFRGEVYLCSKTTVEVGTTLVIGGREVDIRWIVRIRKIGRLANGQPYEFTAANAPADGHTVTLDGVAYKIVRADDTAGAFTTLHLGSVNK